MSRMGSFIRKCLFRFGIVVYRIPINERAYFACDPLSHNSLEKLNEFYSNSAAMKKYFNPKRLKFFDSIIDLCVDKNISLSGKNIADLGCGVGHLLKIINNRFKDVSLVGLEYSDEAIRISERMIPNARFIKFDIYESPALQFDLIFCVEVLEHLLHPHEAMKNCLKMLHTNGVLVITVPNGRNDTFTGHINFWSPESWRMFIESSCPGFHSQTGMLGSDINYAIIKH